MDSEKIMLKTRNGVAAALMAGVFVMGGGVGAQEEGGAGAAADAAADAPVQELIATVQGVAGRLVQVRAGEDMPWETAEVGMRLGEGAEVRTGPGSRIQLAIPPAQTVTLDRLGTMKVLQAFRQADKVQTDVGMKYGRARYQIEAGGLEYESNIHSPSAMLAIRGSDVIHQHDAFSSYAYGDGNLQFLNRLSRQAVAFGGNGAAARVTTQQMNAAANARAEASQDAKGAFAGLTAEESELIASDPGVGGNDLRGFAGLNAQQLAVGRAGGVSVAPPSTLIFALDFAALLPVPTDVDFAITDPSGFTLTAANGMTPDGRGVYDDDGVANPVAIMTPPFLSPGTGSEEVIYTRPLPGQYMVTITNPDITFSTPAFANVLFVLEGAEGQDPAVTQVLTAGNGLPISPGVPPDINLTINTTIID